MVVVWRSIQVRVYSGSSGTWFSSLQADDAQAAADAGGGVHDVRPLLAGGVVGRDDRGGRGGLLGEDRGEPGDDRGAHHAARDREAEAQEGAAAGGRGRDGGRELLERHQRRVRRSGSAGGAGVDRGEVAASRPDAGSAVRPWSTLGVGHGDTWGERLHARLGRGRRRGIRGSGRRRSEPAGWRWLRALKPSGPWQVRQGGRSSSGWRTTGGRFAMPVCGSWHSRQDDDVVLAGHDLAELGGPARGGRVAADADLVLGHRDRDLGADGLAARRGVLEEGAVAALAADARVGGGREPGLLVRVALGAGARGRVGQRQDGPLPGVDVRVERVVEVRVPGHRDAHEQGDREGRGPAEDGDGGEDAAAAGARPDASPRSPRAAAAALIATTGSAGRGGWCSAAARRGRAGRASPSRWPGCSGRSARRAAGTGRSHGSCGPARRGAGPGARAR